MMTSVSVFQLIMIISHLSLQCGLEPDRFKVAAIKPLLKKSGADHENFSNFRPVSNLYFLSKVTEKAVAAQLTDHLNDNDSFLEEFQSAYKCHHSTETALVRVHNDILMTTNRFFYYCLIYRLHLIPWITRFCYQDWRIVLVLGALP